MISVSPHIDKRLAGSPVEPESLYNEFLFRPDHYRRYEVPVTLNHAIERFFVARDRGRRMITVVADAAVDIRFNRSNPDDCVIVGPLTRVSRLQLQSPIEFVSARLRPLGAAGLLKHPLHTMNDRRVSLRDVLDGSDRLIDEVCGASSSEKAVAALGEALTRRVQARAPNSTLREAVALLTRSGGKMRVSELSSTLGVSRQRLNVLFLRDVGVTPKLYARIIRMRRLLASLPSDINDWADLAASSGYCDQAHMIDEFKALVGLTPAEYQKAVQS
jgi:AraC-like DNA-binding protein